MNLRVESQPEEDSKAKGSEVERKTTHRIPAELLDPFWGLADLLDEKRIQSAITLLQTLKKV